MLSMWQKEEWMLKQRTKGDAVHHVYRAVRLSGTLDASLFQQKIDTIVQEHVKMTRVDLQQTPLAERESEVQRTLAHWVRRPFDDLQEPLFRAVLVQTAPDDHVLLLVASPVVANEGFLKRIATELLEKESSRTASVQLSGAAGIEYWKRQLSGAETFLGLPLDRSRPARHSQRSAMHRFSLAKEQAERLTHWCKANAVSLEAALLSVYAVLLSRYTRQKDMLIGTEIAGHVLPLRIDLQELPTPESLCKQVRDRAATAAEHVVPLDQLVQEMTIVDDPSYNPLVQVSFAYEEAGTVEWVLVERATSPFDLKLQVQVSVDEILCAFQYNEDLFEQQTMERLALHWQTLLDGWLEGTERSVFHLPFLTSEEMAELERWNDVTADYPMDKCLHQLFEEQVDRTPDAVAAIYGNQKLTYRELEQRANRLARYLQQHGVAVETRVGVYMERSLETVIALFAILKAGGAYVPLDPGYPMERILLMLEDAEVPVLLTGERWLDRLPALEAEVLCVDRDWPLVAQESADRVQSDVASHNLSYVIFTSGSTGRPKGVMIEHVGIVNRLKYLQETYPLSAADRVLHKTPLAFDFSVFEFFWTLTAGAALVVTKPDAVQDTAYMVDLIQQEQITTVFYVPSMLQLLIDEPEFANCTSLQRVICSGEPLTMDLKNRFYARLPEADLINQYGPTEMTVEVTSCVVERENTIPYIPIGGQIANTKIYLLDEWKQPVPVGVPGELYLGGIGVSRGYLKRPELTAAVFLPDPFSQTEGARMYKTGDLAVRMPHGHLRYLSRVDHQVKVRGLRIELGEIEFHLLQYQTIREAVVIVREDLPGRQQIVAYLVLEDQQQSLDVGELRRYLKERIPEYMVPAAFVLLEAFPLSPSGKTDRRLLPKPERIDEEKYSAPTTKWERKLADIWADVLRLEQVSIHDSFFLLGGDSIQSIQVVSRVNRLGVKIHTEDLLLHPTIAELAAFLEAKTAQERGVLPEPLLRELPYWAMEARQQVTMLAADGVGASDEFQTLEVVVAGDPLHRLQNELMKSYRMQMSEVLLTALLRALQPDDQRHLWVIDVQSTAVPESSHPTAYPVLFDFDGRLPVAEQLQAVKEQSRQVPNQGHGYAQLRYGCDLQIAEQLSSLPQAQVWFFHEESAAEGQAVGNDAGAIREYLLRVDSQLADGELSILFEVGNRMQEVPNRFAKELNYLIEQGARTQAQSFTPADFAAAKLDANQLNQFLAMISKSNGGQTK